MAPSARFLDLLDELSDLHIRKNAGYSGADSIDPWRNFRQCESFGISTVDGVITRMSDKWSRLQSLWRDASNEQVGESIEDTLKDLASYALILICLLNENEQSTTKVSSGKSQVASEELLPRMGAFESALYRDNRANS